VSCKLPNNSQKTNCHAKQYSQELKQLLQHFRLNVILYFSVKVQKHAKNCTNIFENPIKILKVHVFMEWTETGNTGFKKNFRPYQLGLHD